MQFSKKAGFQCPGIGLLFNHLFLVFLSQVIRQSVKFLHLILAKKAEKGLVYSLFKNFLI